MDYNLHRLPCGEDNVSVTINLLPQQVTLISSESLTHPGYSNNIYSDILMSSAAYSFPLSPLTGWH